MPTTLSLLVTDAADGIGAIVADAAAQLGHEVAGLAEAPRGSVHQQAEEWLAVMAETEPASLLVCGVELDGGGRTRRSVDAACAALAAASRCATLQRLVVISSGEAYGASAAAPTFVAEECRTDTSGVAGVALRELEQRAVACAATRPDVVTTILRPAEVLGARPYGLLAEHLVAAGDLVTADLGYDPQVQFVTDHDLAVAVLHALRHDVPGVYNIAPADSCTISDAIRTAGLRRIPFNRTLSMLGSISGTAERWTPELHRQLRYGRALDARRAAAAGFPPPAGALDAVRGWARLRSLG